MARPRSVGLYISPIEPAPTDNTLLAPIPYNNVSYVNSRMRRDLLV